MKLPNFTQLFDSVKAFEYKNRTSILSGLAITGLWTTGYLAYKAGRKIERIVSNKPKEDSKEQKKKVVKDISKALILPVAICTLSTVDILGTLCVSNRRIATLSVACSLAETTLREHKEKLVEVLGEKNAQKVREAISKEKVTNNKTPEPTQIINTGGGDTLCYDEYSGRYFYSSPEKIGEAIVKLSYDIQSEMWVELNRLYVELGLKGVKMGDDLGWSVDHTDRGRIPVYYTAILTENNRPCIAMQFDVEVSPDMLYTS